jgi:hypothetical protein
MKKLFIALVMALLSLTFIPLQCNAADVVKTSNVTEPIKPIETTSLKVTLTENSVVGKTELKNKPQELRMEGRRHRDGGMLYISGGAILVVILILILI